MSRPSTPHRPTRLPDTANTDNGSPPKTSRKSAIGFSESTLHTQSTPPSPTRGRMSLRYPSTLSRDSGRIPLHKRGKSKTYETMEDLLREAGYKETRIFTPETKRTEREGNGPGRTSSRVGAVVGYLAGLVPGMNRSEEQLAEEDSKASEEQESTSYSMPSSPLTGKRTKALPSESNSPQDLTTRTRMLRPGAGRGRSSFEQSLRPQTSASESLRAYAQLSAAQGYLRHMSSTPNISKSARPSLSSGTSDMMPSPRIPLRGHTQEEQPPLPSGWLDSVTKAVLGSSTTGAHPGQPRPSSRTYARSPIRTQYRTNSHIASTDHMNKARPMVSLRSQTAPGAVNTVMVVCRSAPSSRSSSRVGDRLMHAADRTGKPRRASRPSVQRRSRGEEANALPSLASTLLENDSWAPQWVDGKRISSIALEDYEYSEEDEDDGEIDLAQLLLPPKRQKSIRSLRQHLHRSESARALRTPTTRPMEPYILDDDEDFITRRKDLSKERRTHRCTPSDEGSGFEGLGIPGIEQHESKRKRGLPNTWSNLASGK